ncbi:hypothetical protein RHMOL_Rhmol07G0256000 [Rhododendron molle]|uniref:Uncharacterized protein n=1 Tax=Rhododendron molle TaxID=49168 RepID=A0ACC0N6D9_RHOML|nr:hypothetical protein RHMOL_Rhmol07G0256000 [Rhododendron molle]
METDLKGILVEIASLATGQLLQDDDKLGNHELKNIIFDCRSMLRSFKSEVKHVLKHVFLCLT